MTPPPTPESLARAREIVGAAVLHDAEGTDWRQALCVAIAEALDQWARQERERAAGIVRKQPDVVVEQQYVARGGYARARCNRPRQDHRRDTRRGRGQGMTPERAFNIIAAMVMANRDFGKTDKTELLRWLRLAEDRLIETPEEGRDAG